MVRTRNPQLELDSRLLILHVVVDIHIPPYTGGRINVPN